MSFLNIYVYILKNIKCQNSDMKHHIYSTSPKKRTTRIPTHPQLIVHLPPKKKRKKKGRLDISIFSFWPAAHSLIFRTLLSLNE